MGEAYRSFLSGGFQQKPQPTAILGFLQTISKNLNNKLIHRYAEWTWRSASVSCQRQPHSVMGGMKAKTKIEGSGSLTAVMHQELKFMAFCQPCLGNRRLNQLATDTLAATSRCNAHVFEERPPAAS